MEIIDAYQGTDDVVSGDIPHALSISLFSQLLRGQEPAVEMQLSPSRSIAVICGEAKDRMLESMRGLSVDGRLLMGELLKRKELPIIMPTGMGKWFDKDMSSSVHMDARTAEALKLELEARGYRQRIKLSSKGFRHARTPSKIKRKADLLFESQNYQGGFIVIEADGENIFASRYAKDQSRPEEV
jgi:hypothetical protein